MWEVRYMLIREDASFPSNGGTKILIFSGQNTNYICKKYIDCTSIVDMALFKHKNQSIAEHFLIYQQSKLY